MANKITVDNKLIAKLSKLAKLKFNKNSTKKIKADLEKVIQFVDKISSVNTEGIKPLVYMSDEINILRNDEIENTLEKKDALKNAPQKDSDYFKVPTVLRNK